MESQGQAGRSPGPEEHPFSSMLDWRQPKCYCTWLQPCAGSEVGTFTTCCGICSKSMRLSFPICDLRRVDTTTLGISSIWTP